jgi:hypothetical protein
VDIHCSVKYLCKKQSKWGGSSKVQKAKAHFMLSISYITTTIDKRLVFA